MVMIMMVLVGDDYNDDDGDSNEDDDDRSPCYDVEWYAIDQGRYGEDTYDAVFYVVMAMLT